jgi:hypothetical protein
MRWRQADLPEKTEIVTRCPMFREFPIVDPERVVLRAREGLTITSDTKVFARKRSLPSDAHHDSILVAHEFVNRIGLIRTCGDDVANHPLERRASPFHGFGNGMVDDIGIDHFLEISSRELPEALEPAAHEFDIVGSGMHGQTSYHI